MCPNSSKRKSKTVVYVNQELTSESLLVQTGENYLSKLGKWQPDSSGIKGCRKPHCDHVSHISAPNPCSATGHTCNKYNLCSFLRSRVIKRGQCRLPSWEKTKPNIHFILCMFLPFVVSFCCTLLSTPVHPHLLTVDATWRVWGQRLPLRESQLLTPLKTSTPVSELLTPFGIHI